MTRDLEALHRFLAARQTMPFAWGDRANDCVSFTAAAIAAQGGEDLVADLHWTTEDEAYAALGEAGGIEEAVSSRLSEISPALAKRGDVGVIAAGNHRILTIVEGDTLVGPGPTGLRRLPRRLLLRAWGIE